MAKQRDRGGATPKPASPRKRSVSRGGESSQAKRMHRSQPGTGGEGSPDKAVHFAQGSHLFQGPAAAASRAVSRSASPHRGALRKQAAQEPVLPFSQAPFLPGPPGPPLPQSGSGGFEDYYVSSKAKKPGKIAPVTTIKLSLFAIDAQDDNGKDGIVCDRMGDLFAHIRRFAENACQPIQGYQKARFVDTLLQRENAHLIRYIGLLAQGGATGEQGWQDLLTDHDCRVALVVGIIGRALKEKVFAELWFGATEAERETLSNMERAQKNEDGFYRTKQRAHAISKCSQTEGIREYEFACGKVMLQLGKMLEPLTGPEGNEMPAKCWEGLGFIVADAAMLSRFMRMAPDVVYYWPPSFKDEEFEPGRMEALNLADMILSSPYEKKKINGYERAVLQPGQEGRGEAIVRVACFPGIVAYRKGGGSLASKEIAAQKKVSDAAPPDIQQHRKRLAKGGNDTMTGHEGFRSKVITKAVVLLQWSRQRLLTREAGTSAHLDAMRDQTLGKYDTDSAGFKELYDIARERWPPLSKTASRPATPRAQQSPARKYATLSQTPRRPASVSSSSSAFSMDD